MRSRQVRRARNIGLLAVTVLAIAVGVAGYATHLLRSFELGTVDTRFSIRGKQPRPEDIAVVGIDDTTFNQLDKQWPFPRHLHGLLIERLTEAGATAIAYDVQFTEPTVPREDNALVAAVERAHNVVLSTTEVNERGESKIFGGEEVVRQIGARAANTTVQVDPGGVLRRFPVAFDGLVSFPVALAEAATGKEVDRGDAGGLYPWIDYRGPPGTFPSYSFSKVLRGEVPDAAFRGKTVIVGATAPSLQDFVSTPVGEGHEMAGAEMLANAIWTVENDFPLQSAPGSLNIALIVLFGLIAPAAQLRLRPLPAFAVAVGARPALRRRRPARLRQRLDRLGRLPALGAGPLRGRRARGHGADHRLRAPAGPRHLRPLRPRIGRRRRPRPRRRGPAPGRRAPRGHGHVQRPARLHLVRREPARPTR